jgi:hypothetical protein
VSLVCVARLAGRDGQESKPFFFEKKNQKTFDYCRLGLPQRARHQAKVFASFFKKKRFLASDGLVATVASRPGSAGLF